MSKKLKIYQILTFALGIAFVVLCAYMGITAIQKSMKLKIGFEVKPSFECRIDYGGNTIFCNSTKDPNGTFVGNGFTLNGNILSFNQSFEGIGKTFVLTIYNYSDVSIKISVSGTNASGEPLTLAAYENSAPSGELTLVTTGASEAILAFEKYTRPPYTIYQYGDTANGAVAAPAGWEGYSYVVFDEAATFNSYPLRWIIIGAGTNNHSLVPTTVSTARVNSNVDGAELGANEVLLLSEYVLANRVYNTEFKNLEANRGWAVSDLRSYLNDSGSSNFLEQSGLSAYSQYIKSDNTIKTRWYGEIETIEDQSVFVLTTNTHSNQQSFMAETYLGTDYTNARYKTFQGANTSYWWLRSGGYYNVSGTATLFTNKENNISNNASVFVATAGLSAYSVSSNGRLDCDGLAGLYLNNTQGVRPSFVLNLA